MVEANIFKKSYFKTFIKLFEFGMVGGFGAVLNTLILYVLSSNLGMNYLIASAIATEIAIISNFLGNNFFTFRNANKDKSISRRFLSFQLISLITLFGTVFILWVLVSSFGKELLIVWNLIAILIMFIANFAMNSSITWKRSKDRSRKSIMILAFGIMTTLLSFSALAADTEIQSNETSTGNSSNSSDELQVNAIIIIDPVIESNETNTTNTNTTNNNTTETNNNTNTNTTNNNTTNTNTTNNNTTETNNNTTNNNTTETNNNTTETNNNTTETNNNTTETNTTNNNTNTTNNNTDLFDGSIISVSQLGYHPGSVKQVIVYTNATQGNYNIRDSTTDDIVETYSLYRENNYDGDPVNCQGNMPCLKGDFTEFSDQGTYYIEIDGITSSDFPIDENIYSDNIHLFFEFLNAQMQQGSDYHVDFHSGLDIPFNVMSDGSFIMEADQAALSLIRLGSAYNRNPDLFQFDNHDILSTNKPDPSEYMLSYVNYLYGLQGVNAEEDDTPNSVRLGTGMKVENAFVPGPTNLTSIDVYIPGSPPSFLENVPVTSLCGTDDGSSGWQECIEKAAQIYKCQVDEPCLNITYNDRKGLLESDPSQYGFDVSKGWGYEFGCYFDVDLHNGNFNNEPNPCMIFYEESNREYTSMTLLAYLEAWPAVDDYSTAEGEKLLRRSIDTYEFIKSSYPIYSIGDPDVGFFGASLFLLYDYTGNITYLEEAHSLKYRVDTQILSDHVRGNELYIEEYIVHKQDILDEGLDYQISGEDPEEFFRGKLYHDYKDAGPTSISNNAERVFQFDNNIAFQNSRFILIEGLQAVKAYELHPSPENFIKEIGHNQLSFLTGMNLIQQGAGLYAPVKPMSFIFGIGDHPDEFHSRWLVDTGYSSTTGGEVIGARGTGYQFYDEESGEYVYFDGKAEILEREFGAFGNEWRNEIPVTKFNVGSSFINGMDYIPGWINGPFPNPYDGDTIFNYDDTIDTYEYTETTNEMVATAVELFSYLDADLNNHDRINKLASYYPWQDSTNNSTNTTNTNTTNNNTTNTNTTNTTNTNTTNTTGNSSSTVSIISNSTDLDQMQGSSEYMLREDNNASFSIELDKEYETVWYVDGIEKERTNTTSSDFVFSPGILWVPRAPDYTNIDKTSIVAQAGNSSVEWIVNIENVINPFFSSKDDGPDISGTTDTKIRVVTSNKYLNITDVVVTLSNGGTRTDHALSIKFADKNTTEWSKHVTGLSQGNHYISSIKVSNMYTNSSYTYNIASSRAHYTNIESPDRTNRRSSGSSGGGSRDRGDFEPEIVYSLFEHDVINVNEMQRVYLDAKNFDIGIESIETFIVDPQGEVFSVQLEISSGDIYYGTWETSFRTLKKGEYTLDRFILTSEEDETLEIDSQGISFYAAKEDLDLSEELKLIYFILNESNVENSSEVHLKLDASDPHGINSIIAIVDDGRNESFEVQFELVEGKDTYGTWKGSFIADTPDTTYKIVQIIMKNDQKTRIHDLESRSVYSNALDAQSFSASQKGNLLTGGVISNLFTKESIAKNLKKPFVPTILGFAMLLVLIKGSLLLKKR